MKIYNADENIEDKDACGFHVPGMFDKVDKNNCYLHQESNAIRLSVKKFADKNNLTYFDIRNHHGL